MTRRVLIITAGGTPQVVTETLHALATAGEPWWPEEVVLMTTRRSEVLYSDGDRGRGVAPLLGAGGKLALLAAELGRPAAGVRVVVARRAASGEPIDDIRDADEVTAFADALLGEIRRQTADDSELHLSLAGGRKTMSYLAGAVMSIYGRARDRLSHVLVEPPALEGVPEFWWPGQRDPAGGVDRHGATWSAAAAKALLHTVPFVRLRAHLRAERIFSEADLSFAEAVGRAQAALAADILRIDTPTMSICAGGARLVLTEPAQFAIYRLLAQARMEGWSVGGGEPGSIRLDLVPDRRKWPAFDALGDILKDVWMRGKMVDYVRAEDERDSFKSLVPRRRDGRRPGSAGQRQGEPAERPDASSAAAAKGKIFLDRVRPQLADLRKAIAGKFPAELAERVQPTSLKRGTSRGHWVIPWDPARIEIG